MAGSRIFIATPYQHKVGQFFGCISHGYLYLISERVLFYLWDGVFYIFDRVFVFEMVYFVFGMVYLIFEKHIHPTWCICI